MTSAYLSRGVSPTKDDVKAAISQQGPGLFPGSFKSILIRQDRNRRCCPDGAGTKSASILNA